MTTEIDHWVERFLAEKGAGEANVAARPELARLAGELNQQYWREAERILLRAARASPERTVFTPEERLLLDLGFLDARLVPGADRSRPALLREIYAPASPGLVYVSEWMAQRIRQFVLYGGMSPGESDGPTPTQILRDLRSQIVLRLSPFFKNLPGFQQQAIDLFLSGRVDETLAAMGVRLEREPEERLAEQRRQLQEIRSRMVARARQQARTPEDLALFDQLRELDRESPAVPRPSPAPRAVGPQEREKFVQDELRFVKSALWLGVMGSGLARTYSVLLSAQARLTKPDLERVLALAKQCDPTLPQTASVVIAPYVGAGFYDWDRDTLFAPLIPTREADQAIVQALGTYRILLDKFQQGGELRRQYEQAFRGEDFNQGFVRDYRAWVLGVGRGFKGALDPPRYAFFRERLGPSAESLFGPREWVPLTPREAEEVVRQCRDRINRAEAAFEDYFRLAVAAARAREFVKAQEQLQGALTLSPMDGRALMAMGWVSARLGGAEGARARYAECMALAPGTLWSVYAADELQKL